MLNLCLQPERPDCMADAVISWMGLNDFELNGAKTLITRSTCVGQLSDAKMAAVSCWLRLCVAEEVQPQFWSASILT